MNYEKESRRVKDLDSSARDVPLQFRASTAFWPAGGKPHPPFRHWSVERTFWLDPMIFWPLQFCDSVSTHQPWLKGGRNLTSSVYSCSYCETNHKKGHTAGQPVTQHMTLFLRVTGHTTYDCQLLQVNKATGRQRCPASLLLCKDLLYSDLFCSLLSLSFTGS